MIKWDGARKNVLKNPQKCQVIILNSKLFQFHFRHLLNVVEIPTYSWNFEAWLDGTSLVVKNLPANAGNMGLIPGLGSPPATEQLEPWATTTEPLPRDCALQQEKPLQWEAHTPQLA